MEDNYNPEAVVKYPLSITLCYRRINFFDSLVEIALWHFLHLMIYLELQSSNSGSALYLLPSLIIISASRHMSCLNKEKETTTTLSDAFGKEVRFSVCFNSTHNVFCKIPINTITPSSTQLPSFVCIFLDAYIRKSQGHRSIFTGWQKNKLTSGIHQWIKNHKQYTISWYYNCIS